MATVEFLEWPGRSGGPPFKISLTKGSENPTLPLRVQPSDAVVTWYRGDEPVTVTSEGDYQRDPDGNSLVIRRVADVDEGSWRVTAEKTGFEGVEKEFEVTFVEGGDTGSTGATNDQGPRVEVGEWDPEAAKWIGIAVAVTALVLTVLAAVSFIGLSIWEEWETAKVPAALVLFLAIAGSFALAAAAGTAALEVRGRMRKVIATPRGFGLPSVDQAKALGELLKGFGSLKEPAMLAVAALGLFGAATALAWHLTTEPEAKTTADKKRGTLQVRVGNRACKLTVRDGKGKLLKSPKAGIYALVVRDESARRGFTLKGPAMSLSSTPRGKLKSTSVVRVRKGSYVLKCNPGQARGITLSLK